MILFSSFVFLNVHIQAQQPPMIVKGYIYINGTITKPEKVNLTFTSQIFNATINESGGYSIVVTDEEVGNIGEFNIVYNKKLYQTNETITVLENESLYNIDLHITSLDDGIPIEDQTEIPNDNNQPVGQQTSLMDSIKSYLPFIIIILTGIVIGLVILLSINIIKERPKRQRIFYYGKKDETTDKKFATDKVISSANNKKFKSVEEEVDELLSKMNKIKK